MVPRRQLIFRHFLNGQHRLSRNRRPVEHLISIVGQLPAAMQAFDDRFETNRTLASAGLPVAQTFLLSGTARANICGLDDVEQARMDRDMTFPLIVKSVRGRGSQGVTLVDDISALQQAASAWIDVATFGDMLMVKEFLVGDEMTVAGMPPAAPQPNATLLPAYWGCGRSIVSISMAVSRRIMAMSQ